MKRLLLLCATLLVTANTFVCAQDNELPEVVMHTNMGDITIEVFAQKAPHSAENFLRYVKDGYYDGTIFHRVIPGFVIQGGGFTTEYKQADGQRDPIKNESDNGLKNKRGTLSMARTPNPDSATSQFFINLDDNTQLNYRKGHPGYAVFGKVIKGMAVVDKIAAIPTGAAGPFRQDVPQKTVVIESAQVVSQQ